MVLGVIRRHVTNLLYVTNWQWFWVSRGDTSRWFVFASSRGNGFRRHQNWTSRGDTCHVVSDVIRTRHNDYRHVLITSRSQLQSSSVPANRSRGTSQQYHAVATLCWHWVLAVVPVKLFYKPLSKRISLNMVFVNILRRRVLALATGNMRTQTHRTSSSASSGFSFHN